MFDPALLNLPFVVAFSASVFLLILNLSFFNNFFKKYKQAVIVLRYLLLFTILGNLFYSYRTLLIVYFLVTVMVILFFAIALNVYESYFFQSVFILVILSILILLSSRINWFVNFLGNLIFILLVLSIIRRLLLEDPTK